MVAWVPRGAPIKRAHDASYCVAWSPDDRLLGSAGADGRLLGYEARGGKVQFDVPVTAKKKEVVPLTALAWVPKGADRVVWAAQSNGVVMKWDCGDGKELQRIEEPENDIYTLAVTRDGGRVCTGGQDGCIRVYDAGSAAKEPVNVISLRQQHEVNLHPVRIYCLRFAKHSPSVVAAGGWDGVKLYDIRAEGTKPVRDIFGPVITGSALDFGSNNTLVTASHRPEDQVEQWDVGTGDKIRGIPCPVNNGRFPFLPAFCALSKVQGGHLAVGGGGEGLGSENAAFVLDMKTGGIVGQVAGGAAKQAFHTCDFNQQDSQVAFGDASGHIHILEKKSR
eukprot:TRINITY_DN233_c1_g1_i1.p2 TRINITY_DN233_c1_g1~~TRINITY_DN233_c1_g1_i1.p2  ORF type:complete len:335 (+),score=134.74 TRINITY_DN233_c1_g1_i1:954-1958(+)